MKLTGNYVLKKIADKFALLPLGQKVVESADIVQVNETASYIIETLAAKEMSFDELLDSMAEHFQAEDSNDRQTLCTDLENFISVARTIELIED